MAESTDLVAADMAVATLMLPVADGVEITAAKEGSKLPTFSFVGYTGAEMRVAGFFHPVIVDLAGAEVADPVDALINHDSERIVGQGKGTVTPEGIHAAGTVMSEDADASRLTTLSKNGFKWQASIGADVLDREFLAEGKKAVVNGREVVGPLIIARKSLVHEISFVRRGADSQTSAAIAASHSPAKEKSMDPQFKLWLEANEFTPDGMSAKQMAKLESQWKAETNPPARDSGDVGVVLAGARAKVERGRKIADITAQYLSTNPGIGSDQIAQIEAMAAAAQEGSWSDEKYELELRRASTPQVPVFRMPPNGRNQMNDKVIEAAVCMTGRLEGHEQMFDEQTLEAAHKQFRHGIGLKQIIFKCAESHGYRGDTTGNVTVEAQRYAFNMVGQNRLQAAGGFSPLDISTIVSATANKFLQRGFNAVDMTPLRISRIKSVRNFQQITTISLTGAGMFEQLGAGGEIKHKSLGEQTYTNQADTYAGMLSITRKDIINDDLSALTDAPMKLGRGAGLKLNDIFWTEWLGGEGAGFWASGNSNINTGAADMTIGGLEATEVIFMNQTDYDGFPLGIQPKIILVPTALKSKALTLMDSEKVVTGASATLGDSNPFKGRFVVESSPYMSNSSYTGYSAQEWYMMADPNELAVIEIVALNGRVEPTVEQADADFNVLGIQMRGYSDVGVNLQEKKASVLADGNAS